MGGSYYVPRNVKGEGRILYIFTLKSFAVTLAFGLVGLFVNFIVTMFADISIFTTLIIVGIFAAIGYGLATFSIPDVPAMGPFRKAGGENIGVIILRALSFKRKKKIYLYNYKRKVTKGGKNNEF